MTNETHEPTTTCQICGRPIKSNKGLIAHHGYKRPDQGWQTASCLGARHLPYEVSCDYIPTVIAMIETHITNVTKSIEAHMTNPPATLIYSKYRGAWNKPEQINVKRPANFDVTKEDGYYLHGDYAQLFFANKRGMEADIKSSQRTLDYLAARLAAWVAPESAEVK